MSDEAPPAPPAIRHALPEDVPALARLEAESLPHPWSAAQLASELRQRGALGLVIPEGLLIPEAAATLAGYALFRRVLDEAELLRLAVSPGRRRRGLARALVERGVEVLRAGECANTFLEVREDNGAAIRFYEQTGWHVAGRRPRYYPDGAAALLYRRRL